MKFVLSLFLLSPIIIFAQSQDAKNAILFSGFIEPYFSLNSSTYLKNSSTQFDFTYNHNAQQQLNVNLAFIKAAYSTADTRANIALMSGTYANANLATEPSVAKMILEANAGVKLSNKKNIWIDAGVMPSHIGYETAIGKDNITLTRSMMAENSPYFETGARISYTSPNEKLYIAALVLNGWQTIMPTIPNGFHTGAQVTYQATKNIKINYSNYFNIKNNKMFRMYHDVFAEYSKKNTKIAAVVDYGTNTSAVIQPWFTYSILAQQKLNAKHAVAARVEYFKDNNNIFTTIGSKVIDNPFGISANYDYSMRPNAMFRFEPKAILTQQFNSLSISNYFVFTTSLCINF